MSKIGVLTFAHTKDNYGQVLQYLATQEYLKGLGHEATLVLPKGWRINYKRKLLGLIYHCKEVICRYCVRNEANEDTDGSEVVKNIKDDEQIKNAIFAEWARVTDKKEKEFPRHFEEFREKYFSRQYGTYDDVLEAGYNAYCVGSDQIWSDAGFHTMLGWVPKKIKKFTIAPSVGHRHYTDEEIKSFKKYLQEFDFITVRENNGLDLCNRCGQQHAKKILDPIFLLNEYEYTPFIENMKSDKPFVFVYLLGGKIQIPLCDIMDFCKTKGLEVRYVESQGRNETSESLPATVEEWLGLMKESSFVLTNSFHGMALSIVFKKPFLVFPLVGAMSDMNGRINDLSRTMGLEDRIYKDDLSLLFSPINWSKSEIIISQNKSILTKEIERLEL